MKYRWCVLFTAILCLFACAAGFGCQGDDDEDDDNFTPAGDDDDGGVIIPENLTFVFLLPGDAAPAVRLAAQDAADLLDRALETDAEVLYGDPTLHANTINIVLGFGTVSINSKEADSGDGAVFSQAEIDELEPEAFRIRVANTQTPAYVIVGGDARGEQYGLYDLLEIFGYRFFHPEQTFMPKRDTIVFPQQLDLHETPSYGRRGFHIHTMHPLPATEFLMRDDPLYLQFAENLLLWHVRNKQNYMQWELLRTVDYDATVDHFNAIAAYAHDRLIDLGIVSSYVFAQQKAWRIVPDLTNECKEEMEANIDQLMQVPWDHLHFEMGSSEFTKVEDTLQVKWMDNTVSYLREAYPETDASVKVHCSSDQKAPNYGNINFNYLAQHADPGMGVYPHTVQFYDLQGPAPAYGNEDFSELLEWTKGRVDERKVYYYPESAYWCSFDIDVPLFLPVYLFNRWKDLVLLSDLGIDGHVTFTSGHEWGYWLTDWGIARLTWDSNQSWIDTLEDFAMVFGKASTEMTEAIRDLGVLQEEQLIGKNLASYIAGEDTWDELGFFFGVETHPKPVTFRELYRMDLEELLRFEDEILPGLEEIATSWAELLIRVETAGEKIPSSSLKWYEEMVDSFRVNSYRADHAFLLWSGAVARRYNELGEEPDGEDAAQVLFTEAREITPQYLELMRKREAEYRYPVDLSIGTGRSLTSYDFTYLWQASTGYWYQRYERQAIDKELNPLLMNVIKPIWFFL
jgi:hypothetical protein